MVRKVLVAHDFTETANRALEWAAELVRDAGGQIRLLHVVLLVPPTVAPEVIVPIASPTREDLEAYTQRLRDVARLHSVEAECEVMVGANIGAAVCERAAELGSDLVVLGTHGRGPVARALLGSVADHVVRHAPCPVVTLREHKKRRDGEG